MMAGLHMVFFLTLTNFVVSTPMFSMPQQHRETNQEKGSPEVVSEILDANIRELENLKQTIDKTLEMFKSQFEIYTNINRHVKEPPSCKTKIKQDGNLVAWVEEHVGKEQAYSGGKQESRSQHSNDNISTKTMHQSSEQLLDGKGQQQDEVKRGYGDVNEELLPRDAEQGARKSQFSPMELAEYVFWTGDEKGVTLAIEEFLQTGLITKAEAITFLQQIKLNLDLLQQHYLIQLGLNGGADHWKSRMEDFAEDWDKKKEIMRQIQQFQGLTHVLLNDNYDLTDLKHGAVKKSPKILNDSNKLPSNNIIDRLRTADLLYNEYSLQEIIYQLAKVMFTQGFTRGSGEVKHALEKFTDFLEREVAEGHISKVLEKQVLDILITSLTDTLNAHPEISSIREYSQYDNQRTVLRQRMQMIPPS